MTAVEADGLLWCPQSPGTEDDMGYSEHEWWLRPCFADRTGSGVFVDVGAHVGHWALRMARQASRVIAVEPNPATAAVLRRNVALNGLRNVTVIEAAAWSGPATLYVTAADRDAHRGGTQVSAAGEVPVRAVALDEELRDIAGVTLVKLDAEGADLAVLRGLRVTLARERPDLLIEPHPSFAPGEMDALLAELGYAWQRLPQGRWLARPDDEPERVIRLDASAPPGFEPFSNVRHVGSCDQGSCLSAKG